MGGNAHFSFYKWLKNRIVEICNTSFSKKNVKHSKGR